jgi:hypothetical protein
VFASLALNRVLGLDRCGNARRAIDIQESGKVDEAALKDLIRAAVALNLKGNSKPKPRRASSKWAD